MPPLRRRAGGEDAGDAGPGNVAGDWAACLRWLDGHVLALLAWGRLAH